MRERIAQTKHWFLSLPRNARHTTLIGSAVLLLLLVSTVVSALSITLSQAREVARAEPTIARLLGYQASVSELEETLDSVNAQLEELAYTDQAGTSMAGAELQQVLRNFAEDAGATVSGSKLSAGSFSVSGDTVEPDAEPVFEELIVDLSLDAQPMALDTFLNAVAGHRPRLTVRMLEIQKRRPSPRQKNRGEPNALNIRASIVALSVVSE